MTDKEQITAFADAIDRLVEDYRAEFDLTYAAAVGVLQMKIHLLCEEAGERSDEV
jgi:hypothetical protein